MVNELNEMLDRIKQTPIKKLSRLGFIYVRITVILDYVNVINNNVNQLTTPASKQAIITGQEPTLQLYDYLILEICSFYDHIKVLKKDQSMIFPKLPEYLGKLYTFRDTIPGHMDRNKKLKKREDFVKAYNPIFNDIGVKKIMLDLDNYYTECERLFKNDI